MPLTCSSYTLDIQDGPDKYQFIYKLLLKF